MRRKVRAEKARFPTVARVSVCKDNDGKIAWALVGITHSRLLSPRCTGKAPRRKKRVLHLRIAIPTLVGGTCRIVDLNWQRTITALVSPFDAAHTCRMDSSYERVICLFAHVPA